MQYLKGNNFCLNDKSGRVECFGELCPKKIKCLSSQKDFSLNSVTRIEADSVSQKMKYTN